MTHNAHTITENLNRLGFKFVPVKPKGKAPQLSKWQKRATSDPDEIEELFNESDNVGLFLGKCHHEGYQWLCIDVDDLEQWIELTKKMPPLPETLTVKSRRGFHYYFLVSANHTLQQNIQGYKGLELKHGNKQMIAPGCTVSVEGEEDYTYTIIKDIPVAVLSPEWVEVCVSTPKPESAKPVHTGEPFNSEMAAIVAHKYASTIRSTNGVGLRDKTCFDLCVQLRDAAKATTVKQVVPYLQEYVNAIPPTAQPANDRFTLDTAIKKFQSAMTQPPREGWDRKEAAPPTDWPEPQPIAGKKPPEFPMVVFKRVPLVKELIETMAEITCTPVDYAANLVLGVVSAAVQGKMVGCVHDEWSEPLSLMIVIAGARGSGKSQIFRPLTDIIYQLDQKDAAQRLKNIARIKSEVMSLEQEKKAIVKRMQQEPSPEAIDALSDIELKLSQKTIPDTVSSILEDTTPEKAAMTADSNYSRLILASVEGVCLNSLKCKYRENEGESFLNLLLQGHAGDRFTQTRVGRAAIVIKKLAVSALLFVQPGPFRQTVLDNQYYEQRGLTARFLISCPEFDPQSVKIDLTSEQRKTTPKLAMDDYRRKITELWNTSIRVEEDGLINYYQIRFSFQARQLLENFHNDHIRLMFGEIDTPPHMEETLVKARGTTVRLATILHCLEYGGACLDHEVSGSALSDAMILLDYYMQSTDCLYTGATEEDQAMQRIVRWIKKERLSEISSKMMIDKFRYLPSDKENTLDKLEELGYIRKQSTPRDGGGRPKISYLTNPFLLQ
jgi:hypothetical protein